MEDVMELIQMKYFNAVATYGSFTKAAEMMNISQPAISKSVAALEKELGYQLFVREKRTAVLTRHGEMFREHVVKILAELEEAVKELEGSGKNSEIRLHITESGFFLNLVESYLIRNNNVMIRQGENRGAEIGQRLMSGDLEFCITHKPFSGVDLEWHHLMTDRIFLLMPTGHRFSGRRSVLPEELSKEYFIVSSDGMKDQLEIIGRRCGFTPLISCEVDDQPSMMKMVELGMGLGVCSSALMVRRYVDEAEADMEGPKAADYAAVEGPFGKREIGIAYSRNRNMTNLSKDFLEFTIKYFGEFEKKIPLLFAVS